MCVSTENALSLYLNCSDLFHFVFIFLSCRFLYHRLRLFWCIILYFFTFAVPIRQISCVGYTPRALDPRPLQSMLDNLLYFCLFGSC